jgi:hypothetical protein
MTFEWMNIKDVSDTIIHNYDSGDHVFNTFLREKAREWQDNGEAVTYVFVDAEEIDTGNYTRIYGYASINTLGLLYNEEGLDKYLPCVEIRMFSIAKQLRKRHDPSIKWSEILFKLVLQNLYQLSTSVIGFHGIFLNANSNGYKLYTDCGFQPINDYTIPQDEDKLEISDCAPLLMIIDDNALYNIFS